MIRAGIWIAESGTRRGVWPRAGRPLPVLKRDGAAETYFVAVAIISLAWLIGTAKPIPSALLTLAVMTHTTDPLESSSGPPLLPGLMAASVWIKPVRLFSVWAAPSPTM